ncbi:putative DNA photolyase, putative,cryptochrome [Trypanosoma theileri]|uniref:Putative DNA photolyase, putative,cryptochrome n=1 Tax=Trypanosoma theileri TaxID=67003 RepID=A0A1X0NMQ9_9TRYP|nr:putative DNA photolyase, putative,cryptochrome [Trypanosoma theileri]ORC86022.1 putative DNA photolyase, putative,cryptochrome [Trypanosoma theileri]
MKRISLRVSPSPSLPRHFSSSSCLSSSLTTVCRYGSHQSISFSHDLGEESVVHMNMNMEQQEEFINQAELFASMEDVETPVFNYKLEETPVVIDTEVIADAKELENVAANELLNEDEEILLMPDLNEENTNDNNSNRNMKKKKMESNLSVPPPSETWIARMQDASSYLSKQDALYLSIPTPEEVQLPPPTSPELSSCVMVVFAANDLRVHDNYALALAAVRAEQAGGIPVVAVAVVDYRLFAQPSAVGAFFRQSPMRARFFLETLEKLREKLERELHVPLLIRCGRPEEHIPRLAVECGATDVFLTTQYAPHEKYVHDTIMERIKHRRWISRDAETGLIATEHDATLIHPYSMHSSNSSHHCKHIVITREAPVPHSVWQTTLIHVDDLPVSVASMREGERWYHDDVTIARIRPTRPYDSYISRLSALPSRSELLPTSSELRGIHSPPAYRGALPTLTELGYGSAEAFVVSEVIATQSSHPPGEVAAMERVDAWLADAGVTSLLRTGREHRTNTKLYSQRLSRLSPYIALGSLSPRRLYESLRVYTSEHLRDQFVQMQYREALLRLSRRDYWHWMGLRYGPQLFFPYGPRPEHTDDIPDWRHDAKIVQKWCAGLTGIPLADAAMRELNTTGFVAHEGRQALAWLLTRGYGQDWRLGAEWLERCSLDYDPFICYGNFAYCSELIRDDFGEAVRNIHWLAHHHDQTGIYVKKWLPQLSKIPPVYIHRPHVLTPRMQAMHGIQLGKNYPYPLKLWDGAQYTLSSEELTTHFDRESLWQEKAKNGAGGSGYTEALRHGLAIMKVNEWNASDSLDEVKQRPWVHHLPKSAFPDNEEEEEMHHITAQHNRPAENKVQQQYQQEQFVSLE